jgi:hypothetical protein
VGRMISGAGERNKPERLGWTDRIVQAKKCRYDQDSLTFQGLDKSLLIADNSIHAILLDMLSETPKLSRRKGSALSQLKPKPYRR